MLYALSHNVEKQGIYRKMGGSSIPGNAYIKNGLDAMFNSIKDFPLQEQ